MRIRHVLEVGRQTVVVVEPVADFRRDMEQHARAQRLAIPVFELELSVVHGGAETEAEENSRWRFVLPARIDIDVARRADGRDGRAERRPDGTAQEGFDV